MIVQIKTHKRPRRIFNALGLPSLASDQHHRSAELFERTRDQFDTLYQEGAESARVMAVSTHPYITGAAHRIKYYDKIFEYIQQHDDVVFMTGEEILDWYTEETKA